MTEEEAIKKLKEQQNEFNEHYIDYAGINEAYNMAIRSLEAWEKVKEEIKSSLITHGQVVEGEYFADDAESINYGLNKASEIITEHLKEVEHATDN